VSVSAISHGGDFLVAREGTASLYRLGDGFDGSPRVVVESGIKNPVDVRSAVAPDGSAFAVAKWGGRLRVFLDTGEKVLDAKGPSDVLSIGLGSSDRLFVACMIGSRSAERFSEVNVSSGEIQKVKGIRGYAHLAPASDGGLVHWSFKEVSHLAVDPVAVLRTWTLPAKLLRATIDVEAGSAICGVWRSGELVECGADGELSYLARPMDAGHAISVAVAGDVVYAVYLNIHDDGGTSLFRATRDGSGYSVLDLPAEVGRCTLSPDANWLVTGDAVWPLVDGVLGEPVALH